MNVKAGRIAVVGVALAAPAGASPLGDALARHGEADVATLRAELAHHRDDPSVRCTLGAVYARRGDLSRAALYLDGCYEVSLPDELGVDIRRAVRELKKPLRDQLSELSITSRPVGLVVEIDGLPGEQLTTPITIWVKPGTHTIRASGGGTAISNTVTTQSFSRATIYLDAGARVVAPARNGTVDFSDDNALEKTDGPPPDVKRGSIMSNKLRGIAEPSASPRLEDPLATHAAPAPLAMRLGLRVGGGMFDDGASAARVRPSLAVAARLPLHGPLFLAARLDWSRRGGDADSSIDTLGASAGVGAPVLGPLAAIVQLRGDLRFADTRDMMSVRRVGVSIAAALELAIPATPLTIGARFEQGLSELVPGARDRAALVELGVDLK